MSDKDGRYLSQKVPSLNNEKNAKTPLPFISSCDFYNGGCDFSCSIFSVRNVSSL